MENKIYNIKIEKAKNGYIVYTNENLINLSNGATAKDPIHVFESLENLTDFLFNNFNLNN